jgi:hypothetical protein
MTSANSPARWFWQAWLAATVFIFPIPHTVALRNALLLLGVAALLWGGRGSPPRLAPWLKPAAWWLAALTAWILFHSVVVAPNAMAALDQLRANWLLPLLLGGISAWAATQLPRGRAAQAVVAALAAHMLWLLAWQFGLWPGTGAWPFKATPFAAYDYQSTLNGFFLALLLADRLVWILNGHGPLACGRGLTWILLLLSLVAEFALQSRNSTVVAASLLFAASMMLLSVRRHHWRTVVVAAAVALALGAGSLSFDGRWQNLRESAVVGWSSPSMYWQTADPALRPATPSGAALEESAYMRSAWAHRALDMIAEHPMGVGFGHEAFGRAIEQQYHLTGFGSSHSGWLDFALGTGLAGLALLLLAAGTTIRDGWKQFREQQDGEALVFTFFVGSYMLRCLLDGHLSGWRLALFAFICGVLIAAMKDSRRQT